VPDEGGEVEVRGEGHGGDFCVSFEGGGMEESSLAVDGDTRLQDQRAIGSEPANAFLCLHREPSEVLM